MTFREPTSVYEKADYDTRYLSDIEMLTGIVTSRYRTAVEALYANAGNNLHELSKMPLSELKKSLPAGKALALACALELGTRRRSLPELEKRQVRSSTDAYHSLLAEFQDLEYEEFWILVLDRANNIRKKVHISRGGVSGVVVDAKIIFREAMKANAAGLILAHNHPSGQLRPSKEDVELTQKLVAAGKTMALPVLDHLIVTNDGYYSFADQGEL
jgi:DNA repair protein RadC